MPSNGNARWYFLSWHGGKNRFLELLRSTFFFFWSSDFLLCESKRSRASYSTKKLYKFLLELTRTSMLLKDEDILWFSCPIFLPSACDFRRKYDMSLDIPELTILNSSNLKTASITLASCFTKAWWESSLSTKLLEVNHIIVKFYLCKAMKFWLQTVAK